MDISKNNLPLKQHKLIYSYICIAHEMERNKKMIGWIVWTLFPAQKLIDDF
jgi:hypothetical protein